VLNYSNTALAGNCGWSADFFAEAVKGYFIKRQKKKWKSINKSFYRSECFIVTSGVDDAD
jgi:hypothetical protein